EPGRAIREVVESLRDHVVDGGGARWHVVERGYLAAAVFELAQGGRVGLAENEAQDVDALVVQFGPQRLGEDHVERLGGAVGDHVGPAGQSGAGPEDDDPATASLDHGGSEVVAQLHRHHAVALHHRLGGLDRVGKERLVIRVGTGAIDQEPDLEVARGR